MNYSENLQLNMPEPADQFNLEHWNENTQKLDETIHNEIQTRTHESEQFNLDLETERQARENGDVDAKNLENATGVLSIEHGGTGKNTVNDALDNLFSQLQSQTDNQGTDNFIFKTGENIKGVQLSNLANSIYNMIASKIGATIPVGVIYPFGGSNNKVPAGYLPCDGRAISRTEYNALFNVIGTSFGNGDTINTFNVPDLRECVPVGIGTRSSGVSTHDTYALGQFKDDQFRSHNHDAKITGGEHGHSVRTVLEGPYFPSVAPGGHAYFPTNQYERSSSEGHSHDIEIYNKGGSTTHGKQVGVNFIIKY